MLTVVPVDGPFLERVLDIAYAASARELSRRAFTKLDAARSKMPWALHHQRRFALMDGADVVASAQQSELAGSFDRQPVRICGIGELCLNSTEHNVEHARILVNGMIDAARREGADLALVFIRAEWLSFFSDAFAVIPTTELVLTVTESLRHGAPMTMVRGGEERDLAAISAMGRARAGPVRFHLDRDGDRVKYAITSKRLLAGLGPSGGRQLEFVIAEEGITAAAYLVMSIVDRTWTIEECGDRDPSGARVGALLQALIAREPVERRPTISGWLPPGFVPPQVSVVSGPASTHIMLGRNLAQAPTPMWLSADDVLYWRADLL